MIVRLALRSLFAHPIRSAVLAAGFGTGVAVMAILLGVGQIVLEQARSPILVGGGHVIVTGAAGLTSARVLLSSTLRMPPFEDRVRAASPWSRTTLYLVHDTGTTPVRARGGVPSRERALGDPEVSGVTAWVDTPADAAWSSPDPAVVLRSIDRFRPIPDVPARAASWAEWLYFNGRSPAARFYLTFLVGPARPDGSRVAGVRLQLDRGGRTESFDATDVLDRAAVAAAPDLTIGRNQIRLSGLRYHIRIELRSENGGSAAGDLFIEGAAGRMMPPIEIHGAGGWRSGYVVPVMSGVVGGTILVNGEPVSLDGGAGYHDHNWGFWEGVSWQWGQVQYDDISVVYGRVFPPRDAADPDRIPGFLAAIGPAGPIGYATNVTIDETNDRATANPQRITVRGRSATIDLTLTFSVDGLIVNRMRNGPLAGTMDFLQMRGRYGVAGTAGDRRLAFQAAGSAETFRGR